MIKVFIGYDKEEPIAFSVLAHSILKRSSQPVTICPLNRWTLNTCGIHTREREPKESTDFSLTRFLVPYLCRYEGQAIYMDCDMLCLSDISQLTVPQDSDVAVVKHDYIPKTKTKFLGQDQTVYRRKNWSSLMVFNNHRCLNLTPEYIETEKGLSLHQMSWTDDVAELDRKWNWLVGEYAPNDNAKIYHYTLGGPYFHEYSNCAHADLWWGEFDEMQTPITQRKWRITVNG